MVKTRKRFGQHWLQSEEVLNKIVRAAQLKKSDRLLEIGPGTGILTRRLLPHIASLVAVEIDRDLCKNLVKKFKHQDNFMLLQGDYLSLDIDTILTSFPQFNTPNKVVANIPYNITAPILEKLLGTISQPSPHPLESIVLLLQKEVGDRLVAQPSSKAFSGLSVRIQYLAEGELICDVPAKAFYPPPKVDSVVVRLSPRIVPPTVHNPKILDTLVKLGFANRRKMLKNNLKTLVDGDRLSQILEQLNINTQTRGENLSLSQWIALSNHLSQTELSSNR